MVNNMDFWELTGADKTDDIIFTDKIYNEYRQAHKNDRVALTKVKKAYNDAINEIFYFINLRSKEIIGSIDSVYGDIDKRLDDRVWEKIFSENELLKSKSHFSYARSDILSYFLNHDHLPKSVWQIIDKYCHVMRDYRQLKKTFPITFLQHIKSVLNGETMFEYERLKKTRKNPGNADKYIADLFELGDMIDFGAPFNEIEKRIAQLKNYGYYHICFDVERMNYYVKADIEYEKAALLCKQLENEKNPYIAVSVGYAQWHFGELDKADDTWLEVLEKYPKYLNAMIGHAKYLIETENYEQAKEYIFDIIDTVGEHDEVLKLLKTVNDFFTGNYREIYEENPDDVYNAIQYAWCLCQNEEWDAVIDVLSDCEEDEVTSYDLNMLLGRAYFSEGNHKQAIAYLQKWLKNMLLLPCDGSEEYIDKLQRYPAALAILAECFYETGDIKQAIYYMEQSAHAYDKNDDERIKSIIRLAEFLNTAGEYEKAIAIAQEAIDLDDGCVWGYTAHQRAAFALNRLSEVEDDYFAITNLMPENKDAYIYGAVASINKERYDDLAVILERAEKNGIYDKNLYLSNFILAANKVEDEQLHALCGEFRKMCGDSCAEYKDLHVAFYRCMSNRYSSIQSIDNAIECIDMAIDADGENLHLQWNKAMLLTKCVKAAALELFERLSDKMSNNKLFLCDWSLRLQENGEWEKSAEVLRDILSDEDNSIADICMLNYYKQRFNQTKQTSDYQKAKMHIDSFIKKNPDDMYGLSERLTLAMYTDDVDICAAAIEDGEILLLTDKEAQNETRKMMALLYIRNNEPEKALDILSQVKNDIDIGDFFSKNSLEACAYVKMDKYDIAEQIMRKAYKKTEDPYYARKIGDYNVEQGNFSMALRWYRKYEDMTGDSLDDLMSRAYYLNGKDDIARKMCDNAVLYITRSTAYTARQLIWQKFAFLHNTEYAAMFAERIKKYTSGDDLIDLYAALAVFYRFCGDDKNAVKNAERMLKHITKKNGSLENYIDVSYGRCDKLDDAALYCIGMNRLDEAEEYIRRMMNERALCVWCSEPCCSDAYIRMAQLKILQKDYDAAATVCNELLKKQSANPMALYYLKMLEEMKNENNG